MRRSLRAFGVPVLILAPVRVEQAADEQQRIVARAMGFEPVAETVSTWPLAAWLCLLASARHSRRVRSTASSLLVLALGMSCVIVAG